MTTPHRPTIHDQADLERFWRHLVHPLGFRSRSLWLALIGSDDRPTPILTEVADLPEAPDAAVEGLADVLAQLQHGEPRARWALLLCRPGRHPVDPADRAWADALQAALRARGLSHEPLLVATDADVVPIDDRPGYVQAS